MGAAAPGTEGRTTCRRTEVLLTIAEVTLLGTIKLLAKSSSKNGASGANGVRIVPAFTPYGSGTVQYTNVV